MLAVGAGVSTGGATALGTAVGQVPAVAVAGVGHVPGVASSAGAGAGAGHVPGVAATAGVGAGAGHVPGVAATAGVGAGAGHVPGVAATAGVGAGAGHVPGVAATAGVRGGEGFVTAAGKVSVGVAIAVDAGVALFLPSCPASFETGVAATDSATLSVLCLRSKALQTLTASGVMVPNLMGSSS